MNYSKEITRSSKGFYVVVGDPNLSKWVEEQDRLEVAAPQIAFYQQYIPVGGVVLDAGAAIGDHTATYARLVGPTGTVWALEPLPLSFEVLRLNFMDNPAVKILNIGLSDVAHSAMMHREQNIGASFLTPDGEIPVSLETIDSLGLERLDFLHLDVEGYEYNALIGGAQTLARCRPVIVLEISDQCLQRAGHTANKLLTLLGDLKYRWGEVEPHHGPHMVQRDIIAFPVT